MNTWTWQTLRDALHNRSLDHIIQSVCKDADIPRHKLRSKSRKDEIVRARVEIARQAKGHFTQQQIGEALNKNHSTISHYWNHYHE